MQLQSLFLFNDGWCNFKYGKVWSLLPLSGDRILDSNKFWLLKYGPSIYSSMPNLALIGERVGTGAPKLRI